MIRAVRLDRDQWSQWGGDVASWGASDRTWSLSTVDLHLNQWDMWLNRVHRIVLISTVDHEIYNGRDLIAEKRIWCVWSRANDDRFKAFSNARRRGFISSVHLWSNGWDLTVTICINAINQSRWSKRKRPIGRLCPKSL